MRESVHLVTTFLPAHLLGHERRTIISLVLHLLKVMHQAELAVIVDGRMFLVPGE
ncbi:MAG: hypothetical protein HZB25_04530 [Candidatus Eisenbacteria bacterium]|nr:hypothetical protein [Candidatus Eisenbacteria bacterium]